MSMLQDLLLSRILCTALQMGVDVKKSVGSV